MCRSLVRFQDLKTALREAVYSSINKNILINAIYYCLPDLSLLSWLSPSYLTLMLQPISLSWWACRAHWQSISPSSTLSRHNVDMT